MMLRWESMVPLGVPVVPLLYGRIAVPSATGPSPLTMSDPEFMRSLAQLTTFVVNCPFYFPGIWSGI